MNNFVNAKSIDMKLFFKMLACEYEKCNLVPAHESEQNFLGELSERCHGLLEDVDRIVVTGPREDEEGALHLPVLAEERLRGEVCVIMLDAIRLIGELDKKDRIDECRVWEE